MENTKFQGIKQQNGHPRLRQDQAHGLSDDCNWARGLMQTCTQMERTDAKKSEPLKEKNEKELEDA